ncbi:unnamed protein product [Mytilus edulis]|uniref:Uncharacterized protein n=1 Tax=Mytilus edulis TaxID=6550 RepID=A0A8S3RKM7_MYTED|nr:unnamed protein product [Mytilus edulis]
MEDQLERLKAKQIKALFFKQDGTSIKNYEEHEDGKQQSKLSTKAKVVKLEDPKVQIAFGTPTNMQDIFVVDTTGQIRITLWDTIISSVLVDNTYTFKNLAVRNFKNETYLTSTKSTKITRSESIDDAVQFESTAAVPTTIVGTVAEVKITQSFMCKSCTRKLPTLSKDEKYNRCPHCKMLQRTENFVSLCFTYLQHIKICFPTKIQYICILKYKHT